MNEVEAAIRQRQEQYQASLRSRKVLPVPDRTAVPQLLADVESLLQIIDRLRGEEDNRAGMHSFKIEQDGRISITGLKDTMFTEGEELPDGTWLFDATRLVLQVKCLDTGEVFTKVNAWDEATREALVGGPPQDLDRTSPDFPYHRVYNCVANVFIAQRETGNLRPLLEQFKTDNTNTNG